MFNNQPTQVLVTFHEEDKVALSHLLQAASRWPDHFTIVTSNDGPYPTATLCFDGINALVHFSASGILATVEAGDGNLLALDDTVIDVKNVAIYNNGQIVDVRTIAPNGRAFIQLAKAYCYGNSTNYYQQPRSIARDKKSGFMDLSDDRNERFSRNIRRNALSGGRSSGIFGNGMPTTHNGRAFNRHDIKITLSSDDAYLTINGDGAELVERTVVEGGAVFKFQHRELNNISEAVINHALHDAGLSSAWLDTENNIISIVVPNDGAGEADDDKLTFITRIDLEEGTTDPIIVLEDLDGDLYPHTSDIGTVDGKTGYVYRSDLLVGLRQENIDSLTAAADELGFALKYESEAGSIKLIIEEDETPPVLEIAGKQLLLGGVAAVVKEVGDRKFEITFDRDLPMNKFDYADGLRKLLLGNRLKGYNSHWSIIKGNVLELELTCADTSKSVRTMRAIAEASATE